MNYKKLLFVGLLLISMQSFAQSVTRYNVVLQPWANAGYQYPISGKWNAGISVSFGGAINVITCGDKVGEGWMGIANFRFIML